MGLNKQDVGPERAEAVLLCSHGGSKKLEKMRREHLRTPEEFFNWCSDRKSSVFYFTEFRALLNPCIEVPCAGVALFSQLQI